MGLDMYLNKKTYVQQWEHHLPENIFQVSVKKGGVDYTPIKSERISYIIEQVGYWRKFHALHNWFVQNVQNGADDCREYYVSNKQLQILLELLKEVKTVLDVSPLDTTKLDKLFGKIETYDNWYKKEVESTIELLSKLLTEEEGDFYYESSW